jgi:glycosyltransferase involved in cell wall biosynthesis
MSSAPMHNFDLRPKLGRVRGKENRRFLLVCSFDPGGIVTVYEYVALWQSTSRYQIEVLNLWPGATSLPSSVALDEFDGCILHSTVSYDPDQLQYLDRNLSRRFSAYDGVKILIKQDEHRRAHAVCKFLADNAFDILLTCVPATELEKVYPRSKVGRIQFVQALTGYVSPLLQGLNIAADQSRELDISYRGSIQPLSVGRLGLEKRKIGDDVARACASRALNLNISSRWEDRITGRAWFDFLSRSKAVLGVESGSNLFDFTGEVEAWCERFCRRNRDRDHLSEEFYREAYETYLKDFEENVLYAQISPRHFEAAATQTLQILYEGEYSGILQPHRHFVPLRRDLANLDHAIEIMRDERKRREITSAAFEEIIGNPLYRYDAFVMQVDEAIEAALQEKGRLKQRHGARSSDRPRALVLMPHEPVLDPRVSWVAESLARDYEVCEIGTYRFNERGSGPSLEQISEHRHRIRVERTRHDWDWLAAPRDQANHAVHQLALLFTYARLPERALRRALGAFDADAATLDRFRELCTYFVNTNGALIEAARLTGSFHVIVAADLESLPAALVLGHESGAVVVYDAHEYWPYSYNDFRHWEIEFWSGLERSLAKEAAIRVTVSPPLAARLSEDYGCAFTAVPNCTPLMDLVVADSCNRRQKRPSGDEVVFLYQGGFAPGRGIEHLVRAWAQVGAPARLLLRGPNNPFKAEMERLAESLNLKNRRVFFPEPVSEAQLVEAAGEADVGLIPYEPNSPNNRFSCPNKLSQYFAAGLPVIANELDFVQQVILENGLGAVVSFRDGDKLARTIERFARREALADMAERAQAYFRSEFNWETASAELFASIRSRVGAGKARRSEYDFSWIDAGHDMRELALPPRVAVDQRPAMAVAITPAMTVGQLQRVRASLLKLALNRHTRRVARGFVSMLPRTVGSAVKAKLVMALGRLS